MRYFRSSKTENKIRYLIKNQIPVIVFDTETTGTEDDAKIIQISAKKILIKEKGFNSAEIEVLDSLEQYINPQWPLPSVIVELTHITDEILEDKPTEDEVIKIIDDFFGDSIVAAYNAEFDLLKMKYLYERCDKTYAPKGWFDIMDMVRDFNKRMPVTLKAEPGKRPPSPYNLGNVTHTLDLDDDIDFHNASGDVEATIRVMEVCINHYLQNPNVDGEEALRVYSVSYYDSSGKGRSHTENRLNIGTDKGLVYFNTYFRYFASSEIDLRFVNINKLEDDVCNMTGTRPGELHKFKRSVYGSNL